MEVDARVEAWASLQLLHDLPSRTLVGLLKLFGGPVELRAADPGNQALEHADYPSRKRS